MKMQKENCIGLLILIVLSLFACSVLSAAVPEKDTKEKSSRRSWISKDTGTLFVQSFLTGFIAQSAIALMLNNAPENRGVCFEPGVILDPYAIGVQIGCTYGAPKVMNHLFKGNNIKDQNTFLYPYAKKLEHIPGNSLFFNAFMAQLIPAPYNIPVRTACAVKTFSTQNNTIKTLGTLLGKVVSKHFIKEQKITISLSWDLTENSISFS